MNDSHWRDDVEAVIRQEDGERIGYLRRLDEDLWAPMNLLGVSLGDVAPRDVAIRVVTSEAMVSIADVWWCRAPRPLTEPMLDARSVPETENWQRVVVVEVTPDRALLRPVYAWAEEAGRMFFVDLPTTGIVHRTEPIETIRTNGNEARGHA